MVNPLILKQYLPARKIKPKKPLIQPHPHALEKDYQSELLKIPKFLEHQIEQLVIPKLNTIYYNYRKYHTSQQQLLFADDFNDLDNNDEIDALFSDIKQNLAISENGNLVKLASQQAEKVNARNAQNMHKQMKHMLGIDLFTSNSWLQDSLNLWVAQNVNLIKTLEDTAINQTKYVIRDGFARGLSVSKIADNMMERIDVSKSRARFIARDQTAKLNTRLTKERHQELGINNFIWNTSHNERVRPTHAVKDGNVYSYDKPPKDTGNPGDDYQCMCIALPIFPASLYE